MTGILFEFEILLAYVRGYISLLITARGGVDFDTDAVEFRLVSERQGAGLPQSV
jgi:hypothetical protein